jgi:hypothetical protein
MDLRAIEQLHARYARATVTFDLTGQLRALPAPGQVTSIDRAFRIFRLPSLPRALWIPALVLAGASACAGMGAVAAKYGKSLTDGSQGLPLRAATKAAERRAALPVASGEHSPAPEPAAASSTVFLDAPNNTWRESAGAQMEVSPAQLREALRSSSPASVSPPNPPEMQTLFASPMRTPVLAAHAARALSALEAPVGETPAPASMTGASSVQVASASPVPAALTPSGGPVPRQSAQELAKVESHRPPKRRSVPAAATKSVAAASGAPEPQRQEIRPATGSATNSEIKMF